MIWIMSGRKLLIQGLKKSITKQELEIHFQSRKKSGGGDIHSVELNSTKGEAVVVFEDEEGICFRFDCLILLEVPFCVK